MIDLAKLIRTDRGLAINETRIREEVTRVIDLERDIANVSMEHFIFCGCAVLNAADSKIRTDVRLFQNLEPRHVAAHNPSIYPS